MENLKYSGENSKYPGENPNYYGEKSKYVIERILKFLRKTEYSLYYFEISP